MRKIPDLKNIIIAHRGFHDNKNPENSITAFQKAVKQNLPIELDVQLTSDDILVVFHDENLKRMTGKNANLQETSFKNLQKLTLLNTNQKIPTFEQVLKIINGRVLLDIEIKPALRRAETCQALLNELKNYSGPILIKSFDPRLVLWFKHHAPNLPRGLLITENSGKPPIINSLLQSRLPILLCQPDFLALHKTLLNLPKWQKYSQKLPTLIWTIDTKLELEKYQTNKNLGLICNLPFPHKIA